MSRQRNGRKLCSANTSSGDRCRHYAKANGFCYMHQEVRNDEPTIKDTIEVVKKASDVASSDEVKQWLTNVLRGNIRQKALTPTGEVVEVTASVKERRECAALLAKLEGWMDEDENAGKVQVFTGVMQLPAGSGS